MTSIEERQRKLCQSYGSAYVPVADDSRAGIASSTLGRRPINGLRHPASGGANGWFIWCGEEFSEAPDFFDAMCVDHLIEALPDIADFLALAPGHRFLVAGEYRDVWLDANLLTIEHHSGPKR